jgi:hypothetical protein
MYWPLSPTAVRGKSKNSEDMNLSLFNMYLLISNAWEDKKIV